MSTWSRIATALMCTSSVCVLAFALLAPQVQVPGIAAALSAQCLVIFMSIRIMAYQEGGRFLRARRQREDIASKIDHVMRDLQDVRRRMGHVEGTMEKVREDIPANPNQKTLESEYPSENTRKVARDLAQLSHRMNRELTYLIARMEAAREKNDQP